MSDTPPNNGPLIEPEHVVRPSTGQSKTKTLFGFTLTDVFTLLGASLKNDQVLGWFFHFKGPSVRNGRIEEIALSELRLSESPASPGNYELAPQPIPVTVSPWKVVQKLFPAQQNMRPTSNAADQMNAAITSTGLTMTPFPQAEISHLSHATEWADAAFFRRSDLNLMRLYLLSQPHIYNDLFFSGAQVNYDDMTNPILRLGQFNVPIDRDDPSRGTVPNCSLAFSLKMEPIWNKQQNLPVENFPNKLNGEPAIIATTQEIDDAISAAEGTGGVPVPASAIASPCPPYWIVIEEVASLTNIMTTQQAQYLIEKASSQTLAVGTEKWSFNPLNFIQPTN